MSKKAQPMPKKYRCRDCGGYFAHDDMAKSGLTESKQVGYCKPCKATRVRASKAKSKALQNVRADLIDAWGGDELPKMEKPVVTKDTRPNTIIAGYIADIGMALIGVATALLKTGGENG